MGTLFHFVENVDFFGGGGRALPGPTMYSAGRLVFGVSACSRRFRAIVSLVRVRRWFWSFRDRGGFVVSHRWFALGVGFVFSMGVNLRQCDEKHRAQYPKRFDL